MQSGAEIRAAVIVIGYATPVLLARCLQAVLEQSSGRTDVEIFVVTQSSHQGQPFAPVRAHFPEYTWLEATSLHNVARMRGMGVARSSAPLVALLEGDCVPEPGWLDAVVESTVPSLGGPIEPGHFLRSVDWSAFFVEFGRYMAPLPTRTSQLPGANVVYRRDALPDVKQLEEEGFYETFINSSIGSSHPNDPRLMVRHERTWTSRAILETRFNHGRGFASLRTRGLPLARRIPYMALSLALPFLLLARVVAEPFRRRRLILRTLVTFPWIVALSLSWAAGEFAGYAAGPGESLQKWR